MTVIFQQLVMESWDLKKKVKELQRTCEMLQAENLKLKNSILHASESMQDFLRSILEEANEGRGGARGGPRSSGAVR